jgi:hypothetical protein
MKSVKWALLFGFFVWLIPFIVSIAIFPFRTSDRPLFESIMPVVVTLCAVVFSVLYFKKVQNRFIREGIMIGILWLAISIVIDLALFMQGPMKMDFIDYIKDIGLTYLIIPAITIGDGYLLRRKA